MSTSNKGPRCFALVGPTAAGKTDLALDFAEKHDAEIINIDAMQVFRGLDIGTAKPTVQERARVPHHLFDIRAPDEALGAGGYAAMARDKVTDILNRDALPLFVGGTGFYLRCLREGLSPIPDFDRNVRDNLRQRLDSEGLEKLRSELEKIDPSWADQIHPNDKQRILRGLEVYHGTGKRLSEFQRLPREGALPQAITVAYLDPGRETLSQRIEGRAQTMLEAGLVQEVEALLASGVSPDAHGFRAPGYREVLQYIQGDLPLDDLAVSVVRSHKAYARRQRTFFKGERDRISVATLEELEDATSIGRTPSL